MSVYTWGLGKSGQLGTGSTDTQHVPRAPRLPPAAGVHSGGLFTAVLTASGELFVFGSGKHGRLGTGRQDDCLLPTKVLLDNRVVKVSCGLWHAAALTEDNSVYVWGYGKALGIKGDTRVQSQVATPSLLTGPFSNRVGGVCCGNNFTLLWTRDGEAFSWGAGSYGALGHGDTENKETPTKIKALEGVTVTFMDAGFAHCGAVSDSGNVFMFGRGEDGALGLGKGTSKVVTTPTMVPTPENAAFVELSCSVGEHHGHTLFVTSHGNVYSVGDGYKGKLGLGDQTSHRSVQPVSQEHFNGEFITRVSAGGIHSAAVSKDGHVFTWGCGSDGRLGHPEAKGHRYLYRCDIPRLVDSLAAAGKATEVTCSYYHTVALIAQDTKMGKLQ